MLNSNNDIKKWVLLRWEFQVSINMHISDRWGMGGYSGMQQERRDRKVPCATLETKLFSEPQLSIDICVSNTSRLKSYS